MQGKRRMTKLAAVGQALKDAQAGAKNALTGGHGKDSPIVGWLSSCC